MRKSIIGSLAGMAAVLLLPAAATLVAAGSTPGELLAQARAATGLRYILHSIQPTI
jgi:hypothetical protein